jgi:hypothetical protein
MRSNRLEMLVAAADAGVLPLFYANLIALVTAARKGGAQRPS